MHNLEHETKNWLYETQNCSYINDMKCSRNPYGNNVLHYKVFYYIPAQLSQLMWKYEDEMQLCTHQSC